MNVEAWNDLMTAAGATPRLERAGCRGEVWMADLTDRSPEDVLERAEAVCHRCASRTACIAWVDRLEPHLRPAGYAAGRLLGQPPAAPRLKADPADDVSWLAKYLRARPGRSAPAEQVVAAAAAVGIPESRLRRVRKACGVTVATGAAGLVWALKNVEHRAAS